jgi:CBS domain-containing protein
MNVAQLMTRNVKSCRTVDALNCPAGLMWEEDVGCVPVLDDEGSLVGMITDRDIAMAALTQGRPLADIQVSTAMSRDLHAVGDEDTVIHAEETMRQHKVRRLPVRNAAGKLVGIISINDIARQAEIELGRQRRQVSQQEVAATLAEISTPRVPRELTPRH